MHSQNSAALRALEILDQAARNPNPHHHRSFKKALYSCAQKAKFDPAESINYNNQPTSILFFAHQLAQKNPSLAEFEKEIELMFPEQVALADQIDLISETGTQITENKKTYLSEDEREALYQDDTYASYNDRLRLR